jgi:FMN-dependent dehydrogenase
MMRPQASRPVAPLRVVGVEDLRRLARRRVPRAVFDSIDGGAEGEVTLRENRRAFAAVTFRPRHAVAVTECDLRTRMLGLDLALPFLLAPVGYSRLMHPGGEVAAARARPQAEWLFGSPTALPVLAGRHGGRGPKPLAGSDPERSAWQAAMTQTTLRDNIPACAMMPPHGQINPLGRGLISTSTVDVSDG